MILIDIDDVLNNLCETWCEILNERYGTGVGYEDVAEWDISKFFPNLTKDQVYEPLHEPEIWDRVTPKEGTVEYVKRLMEDGHEVYLCTATDYRNVQHKFDRFVKKYYPYIEWNQVIITSKKQLIRADVLIDDGIHNLEGGVYYKFLMDTPYNRNYDAGLNSMIRVRDFEQAYSVIKRCNTLPDCLPSCLPSTPIILSDWKDVFFRRSNDG